LPDEWANVGGGGHDRFVKTDRPGTIIPTEEEDAIVDSGIAVDPDTYELQDADVAKLRPVPRGRPPKSIKKVPTTIRLDADVIEFFSTTALAG
jgi:hypothetical protein